MIDGECGAVGGMRIGRENRSSQRQPAPVSLCPPQIPHDLTWLEHGSPWWEAKLSHTSVGIYFETFVDWDYSAHLSECHVPLKSVTFLFNTLVYYTVVNI
jgi:hypothetical protein